MRKKTKIECEYKNAQIKGVYKKGKTGAGKCGQAVRLVLFRDGAQLPQKTAMQFLGDPKIRPFESLIVVSENKHRHSL